MYSNLDRRRARSVANSPPTARSVGINVKSVHLHNRSRRKNACWGGSYRSRFDFRPGEVSGLLDLLTSLISNPKIASNAGERFHMRVAFLGLGIMGHAMAPNLVKAGHEVTAWNRTPGKQEEGAQVASSPAEAAQGVEVVWMAVSDTAAVESVLFGSDGVESSLTEGMIVVDSSTISPSATRKFAERIAKKGAQYVDSPMTGSKAGAESGTLLFIVGGEDQTIERLKPLFAAMGKKIFRMGDVGKGQSAKLVMNLQIALIYEGFAESLTLAAKLGIDAELLMPLVL